MADMAVIQALKDELTLDPELLGYSDGTPWMDETKALADLALLQAGGQILTVGIITSEQLFDAIADDWSTRSADQKSDIQFVMGLGDNIQITVGSKSRAMLASALTGATAALSNLNDLSTKSGSRADALGFGRLTPGMIQNARALP